MFSEELTKIQAEIRILRERGPSRSSNNRRGGDDNDNDDQSGRRKKKEPEPAPAPVKEPETSLVVAHQAPLIEGGEEGGSSQGMTN